MESIKDLALRKWPSQLLIIILLCFTVGALAQERVKPAKGYMAGDTIQSPLYGIQLILPAHWNGFLTSGTEVFTLTSDSTAETSIFIFPSEEDLKTIETRWNGHVEMGARIGCFTCGAT